MGAGGGSRLCEETTVIRSAAQLNRAGGVQPDPPTNLTIVKG